MSRKKTLLVLGGASRQAKLILAAREEGYRIVVCDWTDDNPGLKYADVHYKVSSLDREAVLDAAIKERIDGVVSNSEPAMPNVAYISEKLGLVGNSPDAVDILMSKGNFRDLQDRLGLYSPKHMACRTSEEFFGAVEKIGFPLIVKPTVSSASRGNAAFTEFDREGLEQAFSDCAGFSKDGCVEIEQYIEMPELTMLEAEVFVHRGECIFCSVFSDTHSPMAPKMPKLKMFPIKCGEEKLMAIKDAVRNAIFGAGITHGEYNVEMYFTHDGNPFIVEINPRQGGNKIPLLTKLHNGIDMTRLIVTTAVGDDEYFESVLREEHECNYITGISVFSYIPGVYKRLYVSPELEPYIVAVDERKKQGTFVHAVRNAEDTVAMVVLRFDDEETQIRVSERLDELIYPIIEN